MSKDLQTKAYKERSAITDMEISRCPQCNKLNVVDREQFTCSYCHSWVKGEND